MNDQIEQDLLKSASETTLPVPETVHRAIEDTLASLPEEPEQKNVRQLPRVLSLAACLVFVLLVLLPNLSVGYASAMEKIPLIGDLVRVVTIRNYFYSDDNHEMNIQVPEIENPQGDQSIDSINREVAELTKQLMEQFYAEVDAVGGQGHGAMYVDYTVVTNTERWFTLKLSVHLLSGSGSTSYRYYHIDKATGDIVQLADLFEGPDFSEVLTEHIRQQMKERMEQDKNQVYWVDENTVGVDFDHIEGDHNFYFDKNGDLVIPFDKYEVAPGSMGTPEFTIPLEDIQNRMKEPYRPS